MSTQRERMITDDYAIFKKFSGLEHAKEFAAKLMENQIDCQFEGNPSMVDIIFPGATLQSEIHIYIKRSDFDKANALLKKETEGQRAKAEIDHYLLDFTNEELYEVLMKPDEWNTYDYKLAQKILADRGENINEDLIASLQKRRQEQLSQPEPEQKVMVIIGYLTAIMGGLFGIAIGWSLWNTQKTLPNGQKVYSYTENDRVNGRNIFFLGIIMALASVAAIIFL